MISRLKNKIHAATNLVKRYEQTKKLEAKQREVSRLQDELRTVKSWADTFEPRKKLIKKKQEILELKHKLRDAEEQRVDGASYSRSTSQTVGEPVRGALPDFIIIGAKKCGTTSLYHLLTSHPHVERAAAKELYFFNIFFEEGIEWYRRCFPPPRWKNGRRSITGEATPGYLFNPHVPERVSEVVPQARLIALLRNPVDRAYSDYHHRLRKGRQTRTFEEVIEAKRLSGSIYVDALLRWSRFFAKEQMLVLKSEDFFEHPRDTLKVVLDFLDLPEWEPESREIHNRNKGGYEQIDPDIRRRLEDFFEPHNQRLYKYLGVDFGW